MMAEKRQTCTAAFKREAVRLVTVHGYGVAEVARNLGLHATRLGRWQEEHKRLPMERDILGKAAAFVANELS